MHDVITGNEAINLYLDLLTKSVTNTLSQNEPDIENSSQSEFMLRFLDHYIRGPAISMLPLARFENLAALHRGGDPRRRAG